MEMDPEVRRYVGGRPRTREEAVEKFRGVPVNAILLKSENRYIGRAGLHSAGIAFYIARPYWGHGFATEAARAVVEHAFEELKLARIAASVETGNAASVRVLEKIGFKHVRHEPGHPRSFVHFELTAATSR